MTGAQLRARGQADVLAADVEQWRAIPGWEGYYEVSDLGRVRSLPRQRTSGRRLRLNLDSHGYPQVNLCRNGEKRTTLVHHLVLAAFVGPKPEGMEARHMDGNPRNSHLSNLTYGTHSENVRDQVRHGTHFEAAKTHCKQGHEYTPENTHIRRRTRNGRRITERRCVACRREERLRASERAQQPQVA